MINSKYIIFIIIIIIFICYFLNNNDQIIINENYELSPCSNNISLLGQYGIEPWKNYHNFPDLTAYWIWNTPNANIQALPNFEPIIFEYIYNSSSEINANLYILCDSYAYINQNNVLIGNTKTIDTATNINILIKKGQNLFQFYCFNHKNLPSSSGLLVSVINSSTNDILFNSNSSWTFVNITNINNYQYCLNNNSYITSNILNINTSLTNNILNINTSLINDITDEFKNKYLNAIVFFCYRPPKEIFDFASKLKNDEYDIFISINDNNYKIPNYNTNLINIIKLDDYVVKNAGYFNSNNNIRKQVSSRDKAFYYFNRINHINYKHIWFIEEDVFIPSTKTLSNIDKKYQEGDYMSNSYFIVDNNIDNLNNFDNIDKKLPFVKFDYFYWFYESWAFYDFNINKYFKFPWLKCMTAAIRVSRKFLKNIDIFATKYKTLIIDEILYITLSLHNNLSIINPPELSSIVYNCDYNKIDKITNYFYWNLNDIREDYLFHPMKDLKLQNELRLKYNFN